MPSAGPAGAVFGTGGAMPAEGTAALLLPPPPPLVLTAMPNGTPVSLDVGPQMSSSHCTSRLTTTLPPTRTGDAAKLRCELQRPVTSRDHRCFSVIQLRWPYRRCSRCAALEAATDELELLLPPPLPLGAAAALLLLLLAPEL